MFVTELWRLWDDEIYSFIEATSTVTCLIFLLWKFRVWSNHIPKNKIVNFIYVLWKYRPQGKRKIPNQIKTTQISNNAESNRSQRHENYRNGM